MSSKISAVIDNNVLSDLLAIDLLEKLNVLYKTLLISEKVVQEFIKDNDISSLSLSQQQEINQIRLKKIRLIDKVSNTNNFIQLCNTYDAVTLSMLIGIQGIDEGEVESLAQAQKRQIYHFITDDTDCIKQIKALNLNVYPINILRILAALQVRGLLENPLQSFSKLYQLRPFKSKDLTQAFKEEATVLGLDIKTTRKCLPSYQQIKAISL